MTAERQPSVTPLVAFIVISLAVVGYFVGLQSPMHPTLSESKSVPVDHQQPHAEDNGDIPPATAYSEMALVTHLTAPSSLKDLKSDIDPLAEVKIEPGDKQLALAERAHNRAFNGAPPTVPHPVDQMSTASCIACHTEGAKTVSLRIPRMSHKFLAACTQCHVESNPRHMPAATFRKNHFAGLEAPTAGPRSFTGAPPQIPHTTWMRSDCMSCHGYVGLQGLRTTHPWRHNCQQCHAPSAALDQTLLTAEPQFLAPPTISK